MADRLRQLQRDRAVAKELLKIYDEEYVGKKILSESKALLPHIEREYAEAVAAYKGYKRAKGRSRIAYFFLKLEKFLIIMEKDKIRADILKLIRKWKKYDTQG